jgi:hypothetical protein
MLYLGLTNILFMLRYALAGRGMARVQIYYPVLFGLFLFSAFRYQVGCDWSGYYFQYVGAADFDWSTLTRIQEPIWWAILGWINESGLPYPVANIVSSTVFFVGIHVFARRQPDPLGFLVLLFPILIINMPMSGIRQGAAIGLVCIAFTAFIDRRPLKFGLWVMLAAGFHASALVFMLLLPVSTGRYTLERLILAAIFALPGAFFLALTAAAEVASSRYIGTGIDAAGAAFRVGILGLSALYFFLFVRRKWLLAWPRSFWPAARRPWCWAITSFLATACRTFCKRQTKPPLAPRYLATACQTQNATAWWILTPMARSKASSKSHPRRPRTMP